MSNRSANLDALKSADGTTVMRRGTPIMLAPTLCVAEAAHRQLLNHLGVDVDFDDVSDLPQTRRAWYVPVKCAAEWLLALALFTLCSPLVLVLAALVKLTSPGPALYMQTRLGRGGRLYRIYKLRTMRHDAEVHSGPVWAAKDDVRVTPIGRFLRDSHLDELPQLWNVICGEMALIGPRPERPEIAARIAAHVPGFYHRLRVRPGITGLSQMLLPPDDPEDKNYDCVRRKLAHDLLYVRDASPSLDLRIFIATWAFFCGGAINQLRGRMLHRYALPSGGAKTDCTLNLAALEERAA